MARQRFSGFHVEPHYAMSSWQMIAANAAYVATSQGRRRIAHDRANHVPLRDIRSVAMAKGFDLSPRLVNRRSS